MTDADKAGWYVVLNHTPATRSQRAWFEAIGPFPTRDAAIARGHDEDVRELEVLVRITHAPAHPHGDSAEVAWDHGHGLPRPNRGRG
jgi:hypothetical protein